MKKLLILSGKGGTGKTTLSSSIIELSKCTAFADCDVDAPNLHLMNKFKDEPKRSDFIGGDKAEVNRAKCVGCSTCVSHCNFNAISLDKENKAVINQFTCEGCGVCELVCPLNAIKLNKDVAGHICTYDEEIKFSTAKLKMGRGNSGKLVSEVKKALFDISKEKEFAVLDGSPGVGCPVMASINGVDLVLIVTEPTLSGKSDLKRIVKTLLLSNVKGCVCVNKCDLNIEMTKEIENWCSENFIDFVGKIPYDKRASECINNGISIVNVDCKMSEEIKKIYKNIREII